MPNDDVQARIAAIRGRLKDELSLPRMVGLVRFEREDITFLLGERGRLEKENEKSTAGRLAAEASVAKKRAALAEKDDHIRRLTVRLDGMAWVWCDGGCPGGVFRETPERRPLTLEMCQAALHGVEKMCRHLGMQLTKTEEELKPLNWATTTAVAAARAQTRIAEARAASAEARVAELSAALSGIIRAAKGAFDSTAEEAIRETFSEVARVAESDLGRAALAADAGAGEGRRRI